MLPRQFHLFWSGEAVSLVGTATTTILLPLVAVTQLDAGPFAMGLLTAAAWLPWLILGLPAGALVDQLSPRATMIAADLVAAAAAATVPLLVLLDALTVPALVAVAFVIGCCSVAFKGALPRLVTRIVPTTQLGAANSRLAATESASQVIGPGLAGSIAAVFGAALGVLLDALSFLVSAICLAAVRPRAGVDDDGRESFLRRIRAGISVVVHDPLLRYFPMLAAAANFGLTGLITLQVLFLVDDLHASEFLTGAVLASMGVGGALGATFGPAVSRCFGTARGDIGLQFTSCAILLVPLASPGLGLAWMVTGLMVSSGAIAASNVIRVTWRQTYVPEQLLGRVSTVGMMVAFAAMPASALVAGWLGNTVGVRVAIAVMLGVHVAAVLTMPFSPVAGRRDLPTVFPGSPGFSGPTDDARGGLPEPQHSLTE